MNRVHWSTGVAAMAALSLASHDAVAHGFAGSRFFPAIIATDDPFVADELSLPTVSTIRNTASDSSPAAQETDVGVELSKRLTPNLGLSIGNSWKYLAPKGQKPAYRFDNLETALQYQFFLDAPHETVMSAGVITSWGHTGTLHTGADSFTTVQPTFYFGKGFGDLPDGMKYLKPLALTGEIGVGFPTQAVTAGTKNPDTLNAGFALEYSLVYLQSQVQDIGLGAPFNRMVPLVEFTSASPLDRGRSGGTLGTVNPGVIWAGQYFQIGAEAIIPVNSRSGHDMGGIVQLHFFLDDLLPQSLGRPLFGS